MNITQKFIGAFALTTASAFALSAAPAAAATSVAPAISPASAINTYFPSPYADIGGSGADETAEYGRRFGRRRGFGRRGFRRRRGIGIGGLLAGALIIGGIVAVADAANDNRNTRTYPRRNPNVRQVPQQRNTRASSDINAAADQCAFAAEERYGDGAQINNINRIERADNGFNVQGTIQFDDQLDSFSCGVIGGEVQYLEFGRGQELVDQ